MGGGVMMRAHVTPDLSLVAQHPRAAAYHPDPLPDAALRQLARLSRLMRHAPDAEEADWLERQADAVVSEAGALPCAVRHLNAPAPKPRKVEMKYSRYSRGPRNQSGKAKS